MKVLIIIPAYNEAGNIVNVVGELEKDYPEYDYVVINDGSTDETLELCKQNGFNYVDLPINLGLSGAFQTGMKYAKEHKYDCVLQFDGDGQHNPKYIASMVEAMEKDDIDIVIGSRFVTGKKPLTMRMLGSRLLQFCIKTTSGINIADPTSGMRMYNNKMIEKFATELNYGPEPDTVAYLVRCGAKVKEVQVEMSDRIAGESYLNFSRTIKYMTNMCTSILLFQWFRRKEL